VATTTTTIIITVATIITTTGYKNDNMLTKYGQKMSEQGLRTQGECKSMLGLDSFVLQKQTDRELHWASSSRDWDQCYPEATEEKISK